MGKGNIGAYVFLLCQSFQVLLIFVLAGATDQLLFDITDSDTYLWNM
jgi:hypothetical protein